MTPSPLDFEPVTTFRVGLPHFVWKISLEIETDRALRLVDETVMRLLAAGVGDPALIARLMGLDGGPVVRNALVEMVAEGKVMNSGERLHLTAFGEQCLQKGASPQRSTRAFTVRIDPYSGAPSWGIEGEIRVDALRESGLHLLPAPTAPTPRELESLHYEFQQLIKEEGLPTDEEGLERLRHVREVVAVTALTPEPLIAYREAEMELWRSGEDWRFVVRLGGTECPEISEDVTALHLEGAEVIRTEPLRDPVVGDVGMAISAAFEHASEAYEWATLTLGEAHGALSQALAAAERDVLLISPLLSEALAGADPEPLLADALRRAPRLQVTFAHGINPNGPQTRGNRERELGLLRRLSALGDRFCGRVKLLHVGETFERMLLADDVALVTRAPQIEYPPLSGRGIRRERTFRSTDSRVVTELRGVLMKALWAATVQ